MAFGASECGKYWCALIQEYASATRGAVHSDRNVHGVGNLYIIGSSVFLTCGAGSPTLAIVALSHRLPDHRVAKYF